METNPFILALSKTLPESCLQGAVVYLVLQLLFLCYKRSTPALKFNLYYAANLCLFVGFFYTFFHHCRQVPDASFSNQLLQPTIGNEIQTTIVKPNLWLPFSFWTSHYAYLITGLYFVGLVFCILKLSLGLININWFKNNRHLKLDTCMTEISIQLSSNFRLIKTVSVYLSDKIFVPLTIGFIKPMIVFPIALINQLSIEQTQAILLHELAHIKRTDYLLNILLGIVRSFLFFNPVVWLMEREINKYREQCCDDLVLDLTSNKLAYAQALLLIEENRSTQLTFALPFNGKKYTLLERIKRITNMKTTEPITQNKLIVLMLALTTIGISVAWNMPVKKAFKQLPVQHFKLIKEVLDSNRIEQFSNVYHPIHKPFKKIKIINKRLSFNAFKDTIIQSKNKFHITMEDSVGNKKEYNSIDELPADAQKEFLKQNGKLNQLQGFKYFQIPNGEFRVVPGLNDTIYYSSPEWKKQAAAMRKQGEAMRKQFNSPEWKKQMADIKIQGEKIRKQFNSPEWKKQMADIRKQSEEIRKHFNSPEWKKQMEDIHKQGEDLRKQFDSPEWKKQMEDSAKKQVENARKNLKNSMDFQRLPAMPVKLLKPENL